MFSEYLANDAILKKGVQYYLKFQALNSSFLFSPSDSTILSKVNLTLGSSMQVIQFSSSFFSSGIDVIIIPQYDMYLSGASSAIQSAVQTAGQNLAFISGSDQPDPSWLSKIGLSIGQGAGDITSGVATGLIKPLSPILILGGAVVLFKVLQNRR